jgi:hypothetical protein
VGSSAAATNINLNSKQGTLDKLPANSRKVLNKRNNAVFKDPGLQPVVEAESVTSYETQLSSGNNTCTTDVLAEQSGTVAVNAAPSPKPVKDVKGSTVLESHVDFPDPVTSDEYPALRQDGVSISDSAEFKSYGTNPHGNGVNDEVRPVKEMPSAACESVKAELISANEALLKIPGEGAAGGGVKYDHCPAPSEPEDYWEDEDEDNYGDDGYVTARSHRSRGENTTGGATVILFPKVTQKVKRELAIAKQFVEATRTVEDMEDESWDTSMVAEYGDEIFQYMREREVRVTRYFSNNVDLY